MIKEACTGSLEEAIRAEEAGADRIELCQELDIGGITPDHETIIKAQRQLTLPIVVLIRPRGGNFVYAKNEIQQMLRDIKFCKEVGIYGVAVGALTRQNEIDRKLTQEFIAAARPMQVTFHMAFDDCKDYEKSLEHLIELRVDRILTKGGRVSAIDGKETLRKLIQQSQKRMIIMPGGGITKDNYLELIEYTRAKEVHGTRIV